MKNNLLQMDKRVMHAWRGQVDLICHSRCKMSFKGEQSVFCSPTEKTGRQTCKQRKGGCIRNLKEGKEDNGCKLKR